ncbi:MAG: aminopeptidase [Hespellia sp.]|jgi:aminopeptidase|nr:aminopeptidase [Hespellia sp.]
MECRAWQEERNQECLERYLLSRERIQEILQEETVGGRFRSYFRTVSSFMMQIGAVWDSLRDGSWDIRSAAEMRKINRELYEDVLAENYGTSYANPTYAAKQLGEYGQLLSALYTELRAAIPYVFEERLDYLTILQELFLEVYHCFEAEEKPELKALKHIFYWYASDYSDVFLADRIVEQLNPECSFALDIIMNSDFREERFLYRYGEYVTENELGTFWHLQSLPQETLQKMADVYTEGYRIGFVNTGKDLSKKSTVNIRYCLGFEPMIRLAVENFRKMGLIPTIYRAAVSVITKKEQFKIGYYGAIANKQYEYDHRCDVGLVLDKRFVERKLDVLKNTYEKNKELAAGFAGPACVEIFGENPFSPETRPEAVILTEAQDKLSLLYDSKSGQLTNQYIKGEERSYTIVAYPVPEIGPQYREIFDEVIQINTLDAGLYERVQQTLIDALDQGEYVHILGKGENQTDLRVHLHSLRNPEKETIFENCVADVNIPVGEVFTSPVLSGTEGVLFVSRVYLNELQYRNLKITFQDGKITDYTCANFPTEAENRKYIRDNILHNHETLPLGEFAIGTNTTAYAAARKYQIEDKLPILIAEKMGPHFAVGDTCYSWSEEIKVYNPNGKEIIARDNEISLLRKEDVSKAYFHCHTDITIPYEELEEISVVTKNGNHIILLKDGRFVLKGTEILNEPLVCKEEK